MRKSDGYFNGKDMCSVNPNKTMKDYMRNAQTKEFVEELKNEVVDMPLIDIISTGANENRGTWIHPRVATHLAMWISPKFSVKVTGWIEEWKQFSKVNEKKYLDELCTLEPSFSNQKEKEIQSKLKEELGAASEVKTAFGYVDLLTDTKIIEIKNATNWKDALGQILCYSIEYPEHTKVIVLFGEIKDIETVKKAYDKYGVELIVM
jgi:hypothetical protein